MSFPAATTAVVGVCTYLFLNTNRHVGIKEVRALPRVLRTHAQAHAHAQVHAQAHAHATPHALVIFVLQSLFLELLACSIVARWATYVFTSLL